MSQLYVYACVGSEREGHGWPEEGAFHEPLDVVAAAGLSFVAGRVEAPPPATKETVLAHDATLRHLARRFRALLPLRFGQLADDERRLEREIAPGRAALSEALALVEDRVQMTLHVTLAVVAEVKLPGSKGPGARYLLRRAAARTLPELAPVRAALGDLVLAERVLLGKEGEEARVCHLIPRGTAATYRARAEAVRDQLSGVTWRISGAWPPYAFAPEVLA